MNDHHAETKAEYRNYGHYIEEPRSEPKAYFRRCLELLQDHLGSGASLLDVGCAAGEFLAYTHDVRPDIRLAGADVFEELLDAARSAVPDGRFIKASALDLPGDLRSGFEAVTALGLLGIFPLRDLPAILDGLIGCVRPGGRVVIFSPFNEHGVDIEVRHRKRIDGRTRDWELGWNVFSMETMSELLGERSLAHRFHRFDIGMRLEPRSDPVRTWTITTSEREHQLVNGLKLFVDLYFLEIEV